MNALRTDGQAYQDALDRYNRVMAAHGRSHPLSVVASKELQKAEKNMMRYSNPSDRSIGACSVCGSDVKLPPNMPPGVTVICGSCDSPLNMSANLNPRMPLNWYSKLPDSTNVVVRTYTRRLPRRKSVKSHVTQYKRLKKPAAPVVEGTWVNYGNSALREEIKHAGGPYGARKTLNPRKLDAAGKRRMEADLERMLKAEDEYDRMIREGASDKAIEKQEKLIYRLNDEFFDSDSGLSRDGSWYDNPVVFENNIEYRHTPHIQNPVSSIFPKSAITSVLIASVALVALSVVSRMTGHVRA